MKKIASLLPFGDFENWSRLVEESTRWRLQRGSRILPQLNFDQNSASLRHQTKLLSSFSIKSEVSLPVNSNTSEMKYGGLSLKISSQQRKKIVGRTFSSARVCTFPEGDIDSYSHTSEENIGVMLLNLGGPDTLNDVQPFLFNLFADHDIICLPRLFRFLQRPLAQLISVLRAPKSKEGYASIGGGSPLRKITDEKASALILALEARAVPANVHVAMRYWHPFTEEAVNQTKRDRISRLVVLPLYPQYAISTTGSSVRVLQEMFRNDPHLSRIPVAIIHSWY
ncbi:hypothetical protein ACP275_01G015100 [Erythranthe tilingii]